MIELKLLDVWQVVQNIVAVLFGVSIAAGIGAATTRHTIRAAKELAEAEVGVSLSLIRAMQQRLSYLEQHVLLLEQRIEEEKRRYDDLYKNYLDCLRRCSESKDQNSETATSQYS